jgi:ankyrin repeat protein
MERPVKTEQFRRTTMLHLALNRPEPSLALVWKLLLCGAHVLVNAEDSEGIRPLHFIVYLLPELTRPFLATYRIDTNAVDRRGLAPIHYAVMNSHVKPVTALLSYPLTDVSVTGPHGDSSLHLVRDVSVAKALLQNMNSSRVQELLNARNDLGLTPLHSVFINCSGDLFRLTSKAVEQIARFFLEAGAAKEATDFRGHTPADFASRFWPELVDTLFTALYGRLKTIVSSVKKKNFIVPKGSLPAMEGILDCPIMMDTITSPALCADNITVSASS